MDPNMLQMLIKMLSGGGGGMGPPMNAMPPQGGGQMPPLDIGTMMKMLQSQGGMPGGGGMPPQGGMPPMPMPPAPDMPPGMPPGMTAPPGWTGEMADAPYNDDDYERMSAPQGSVPSEMDQNLDRTMSKKKRGTPKVSRAKPKANPHGLKTKKSPKPASAKEDLAEQIRGKSDNEEKE